MNLRYLALIPVAVLIATIFVTIFFDFSKMFVVNPPYLLLILNLIFWTGATTAITSISMKSFTRDGSLTVLLLSCSILIFGISVIISGWVGTFSGNYSVAVSNPCILAASILQVLSSILSFKEKQETKTSNRKALLIAAYGASTIFVLAYSTLVLLGHVPDFFTASGPTLLRQVVLGSAVSLLATTSIIFGVQYTKSKSSSLYWYTLAIALFGIGLFSSFEVKALGDVPTWLGRITLYAGTSSLVAAILASRQKSVSDTDLAGSWAEAFKSDHRQVDALFSKMLDAFVYGKAILNKNGIPVDCLLLEVNDAFEQITGIKKENAIGKKASELVPGVENDPAGWISIYGRVAVTGEPVHFENFLEPLKKWYHVSSYSPKKGYFVSIFEDITDRKDAEETLRLSEERFRSVLNNSLDVVYRFNLQTERYEYMSPSSKIMLGFEPEEMMAMSNAEVLSRVHPDDLPTLRADLARINETGKGISEYRFMRKDGRYSWWSNQMVICRAKDGTPFYRDGFVRDITEHKKADETLRYSNERLELISGIANKFLSTTEPQTLIQEICERVMAFLNCDVFFNFLADEQKEQLHLNAYAGVPKEMAKPFEWLSFGEAVCGCAAQEGKRIVCENIPDIQDHRTALVRSFGVKAYAAHPLFSGGKVIGTLSFGSKRNPTFTEDELSLMKTVAAQVSVAMERKRTEEALHKSEVWEATSNYTRNLIEASLDPLVTISAEGKITDVNKATETVTGFNRNQLIGSDFSDYFTEPTKARAGYKQVFTEGFVRDYPLAIKHKSGGTTEVRYNATVYRNESGEIQGIFAAARDITELKKAEEQALESSKKLKDAERLATIGATAGMVGHDIRNPLQAITGDVFLAKTELASTPESKEKKNALESLQEVEKNIDYINKIVADLQDFARPLNPHNEETDLKLIIDELVKKNGLPENVKANVKVETEARKVVADSAYINRIMYNLVNNAVQAMPKGGKLTLHVYKEASDSIITVKDTGVGIPDSVKNKLFTPMFTTKSKGQGFGLAVVKRMTEALGGTVTFESQEGKGTTFIIRLHTPQK